MITSSQLTKSCPVSVGDRDLVVADQINRIPVENLRCCLERRLHGAKASENSDLGRLVKDKFSQFELVE